jgi:hypothetical protein
MQGYVEDRVNEEDERVYREQLRLEDALYYELGERVWMELIYGEVQVFFHQLMGRG